MTSQFSSGPMGLPVAEELSASTGSEKSATFRVDEARPAASAIPRADPRALRPPAGWAALDGAQVQRLHELYYDPAVPVSAIAPQFGVAGSTLLRWIAEMGWPSRRALRRQSCEALRAHGAALRGEDVADLPEDFDGGRMRDAIAAAVQREMAFVQSALDVDDAGPEARERHARALAHLVQALRGLRAMDARIAASPHDDDEPPPRPISELRAELAQKLERLRAGG